MCFYIIIRYNVQLFISNNELCLTTYSSMSISANVLYFWSLHFPILTKVYVQLILGRYISKHGFVIFLINVHLCISNVYPILCFINDICYWLVLNYKDFIVFNCIYKTVALYDMIRYEAKTRHVTTKWRRQTEIHTLSKIIARPWKILKQTPKLEYYIIDYKQKEKVETTDC